MVLLTMHNIVYKKKEGSPAEASLIDCGSWRHMEQNLIGRSSLDQFEGVSYGGLEFLISAVAFLSSCSS